MILGATVMYRIIDDPHRGRRCYGTPIGQPCPAIEDGTWPEGCDCMNMDGQDEHLIAQWVVAAMLAIAFVCFVVWAFFTTPAKGADNIPADPNCLTQTEARKKFPGQWLYYHGAAHCWDNVRKYAKPDRRLKGGKTKPQPVLDTDGNEVQNGAPFVKPSSPVIYYPTLMTGGGTAGNMLQSWSMTTWPLVTDFDEEPVPFLPWHRTEKLINR